MAKKSLDQLSDKQRDLAWDIQDSGVARYDVVLQAMADGDHQQVDRWLAQKRDLSPLSGGNGHKRYGNGTLAILVQREYVSGTKVPLEVPPSPLGHPGYTSFTYGDDCVFRYRGTAHSELTDKTVAVAREWRDSEEMARSDAVALIYSLTYYPSVTRPSEEW